MELCSANLHVEFGKSKNKLVMWHKKFDIGVASQAVKRFKFQDDWKFGNIRKFSTRQS